MKFKGFTEKQVKAIKSAARNTRNDRAKLWLSMFLTEKRGADRKKQLKKNPELGISSRLDLRRKDGKEAIVQELLEMGRQGLADKVLNFNNQFCN